MAEFTIEVATCRRVGTTFVKRGDWSKAKNCPICRREMEAEHLINNQWVVESKNLVAAQDYVKQHLSKMSRSGYRS